MHLHLLMKSKESTSCTAKCVTCIMTLSSQCYYYAILPFLTVLL